MDRVGMTVTRVGLIVVLGWIGGLKAFPYKADVIMMGAALVTMADSAKAYLRSR